MKKVLLTGLSSTSDEAGLRAWLGGFGTIVAIEFVRDGDAGAPLVVVEMDITDGEAFYLVSRISNYWHDGSLVSARLLPH